MIHTFKIVRQIDEIPINTFFKLDGAEHGQATRNAANINTKGLSVSNMNFAKRRDEKGHFLVVVSCRGYLEQKRTNVNNFDEVNETAFLILHGME